MRRLLPCYGRCTFATLKYKLLNSAFSTTLIGRSTEFLTVTQLSFHYFKSFSSIQRSQFTVNYCFLHRYDTDALCQYCKKEIREDRDIYRLTGNEAVDRCDLVYQPPCVDSVSREDSMEGGLSAQQKKTPFIK